MSAHTDYEFRAPATAQEWTSYHAIRRRVLWEARGRSGVYNENHPDESAPNHYPLLLLYQGVPTGVVRIDIEDRIARIRRMAVKEDRQRQGHGTALLQLAERFALAKGASQFLANADPGAVRFYETNGFVATDEQPDTDMGSVPMRLNLLKILAVLFDLDSTLIRDGGNWRRSVDETIELVISLHPGLRQATLRDTYYAVAGSVWDEIRSLEAPPWGNMDDTAVVRRVWAQVLAGAELDAPETLDRAVANYLRLRRAPVPAFDDARACLEALAPTCKLGIITNGLADQQVAKLHSSGLEGFFQQIATTDSGYGKPGIDIFHRTLATMETAPDRAVYVGDSLNWDVEGANRAGMISVWLNRSGGPRKTDDPVPDHEVLSLAELPDLVDSLSSRRNQNRREA